MVLRGTTRLARAAAALAVVAAAVVAIPRAAGNTAADAAPARVVETPPTPVPGTGAARPRILYDPGAEPSLQARLEREPYRSLFVTAHQRADAYDDRTLGDLSVGAQRDLTRAAKIRAFEYALDRTVVAGEIVPFPTPEARAAVGDQVRQILLQILDRSRVAIPPPEGGWDRDISTSEEIISSVTAYDTLLGAGYDLGTDRAEIVRRLRSVTEELHENYVNPSSASGYTNLDQNNHRTKSGAAFAVAAVGLADDVPADQARRWFDTGADYVDDMMRYNLITGDGAYSEGPFYYRYTTQNLLPYLAVWQRFLGTSAWTTASGLTIPALAHEPQYARTQRWMLDMTVPDGSMAPIDDGNPGRSQYFGILPQWLPTASATNWRWADTPQPFETDGNIDMSADAIVTYDDGIAAAAPTWAPTQFYVEGGNAILRSGWGRDDAMAVVMGEHDTASEFGRDRTGAGRWPQSHEHADPGSFLFHAFGERLAMDPGYLSFDQHYKVNQPDDHNMVLVDNKGPDDYLAASFNWGNDVHARPPAEGQATIAHTLDDDIADAATVATQYQGAQITRRFLFGDDRYLVIADDVTAPTGTALTWMLHGNGGGTSGGTYASTADGGRWTIGGARLDSGITTSVGPPSLNASEATHEVPYTQERTHQALHAIADTTSPRTQALQLLYPTPSSGDAPSIARTDTAGGPGLALTDDDADRSLHIVQATATGSADASGDPTDAPRLGTGGATTDGSLLLVDRHLDGSLRLAWAEAATSITDGDHLLVTSPTAGTLGLRLTPTRAEVVADTGASIATVTDPGFTPHAIDGGCGYTVKDDGSVELSLNRERRATLRSSGGNATPGADAGADQRSAVGATVQLDGTASCDSDGDELTPHWELTSAPAGSSWSLSGVDTWNPTLQVDRPGPYRARLVVTDSHGARSQEAEALVIGGDRCADGMDNDLDGLIDTDDADCDGPEPIATTTTSSSTSTSTSSTSTSTSSSTTSSTTVPGSSTSSSSPSTTLISPSSIVSSTTLPPSSTTSSTSAPASTTTTQTAPIQTTATTRPGSQVPPTTAGAVSGGSSGQHPPDAPPVILAPEPAAAVSGASRYVG